MNPMHAYEELRLFPVGMALGLFLIGINLLFLVKPDPVQKFLRAFPRNAMIGQILLGIGLAWFWLLIAPDNAGPISALTMDLGEFNNAKPILRIVVPILLVLVTVSVRDFLAVRALGLIGLMAAAPLLEAAFLEEPVSRLLVVVYAYSLLTASMFWVGLPYHFRDLVSWATAEQKRWRLLSGAGLAYGIAILVCTLAFWRGY